jgi:Protein of unknown function (DUF3450)
MKFLKKQAETFWAVVLLWGFFLAVLPVNGFCQTDIARQVTQPVEQSVAIGQESQKKRDRWEQERSDLVLLYEQLQQEHGTLVLENKDLTTAEQGLKDRNMVLAQQNLAALRIQNELFPFVQAIYARLSRLVLNDVSFLKEERTLRMNSLETMINNPGVSAAEKYRRVMEAVLVEAEYGNTIEVYQDEVLMEDKETTGNIFRLGRVALFFLSLDGQACARFNVARNRWQPLSENYLPGIRSVIEIGSKRKPAELLSLPLGGLALQGDDQ